MARPAKNGTVRETAAERERRDEEVLRANRELAAYFKGRRTEREARAALRIIKAFIRERERGDPRSLRPLPGAKSPAVIKRTKTRKDGTVRTRARQKAHRPPEDTPVEGRQDAENIPAREAVPQEEST
jgi:hypothetical protein